jgi:hypothetical protein
VKDLDSAVGLQVESRRFYPEGAGRFCVVSPAWTTKALKVWARRHKTLHGVSGWVLAGTPWAGTVFPADRAFSTVSKSGHDIILTIDEVIQHIVEKELDAALARSRQGRRIDESWTAEVPRRRAYAYPPGQPTRTAAALPARGGGTAAWRTRASGLDLQARPVAAALEEKVIHLERVDCSAGRSRSRTGSSTTRTKRRADLRR